MEENYMAQTTNSGTTRISLNIDRCKGCGLCVGVCPVGVLRMSDKINHKGYSCPEIIDGQRCTGCGMCYRMCPDMVIEINKED